MPNILPLFLNKTGVFCGGGWVCAKVKVNKKAKCNHFTATVANHKDAKLIRQQIRSAQNDSHKPTKLLPDQLNIDDSIITDSHEIACRLNEFFSTVSLRLNSTDNIIQAENHSNLINYINSKVPAGTSFQIPPVRSSQVANFIRNLDPRKATGLDGMGPRISKMSCHIISPSIAALINKSIISGYFPNQLKIAKVFPTFKNGTKDDPSNYRPISILPTIPKSFEKHVNSHLMGFLNKYKLIHECQSGFRQKYSFNSLVKLIDQWMTSIDKGDIIGTVFIDF